MNWKDKSGIYFKERGILRIKYLEDQIIAPALEGFTIWLSEFEGLESAHWKWIKDGETGRKAKVLVPISQRSDPSNRMKWFSAEVAVRASEIYFWVYFPFKEGVFCGQKPILDIDLDAEIMRKAKWTKEEMEQYRAEEESGELLLPLYSIIVGGLLDEAKAVYEESFPIGEMFEEEGICERLWGLYEEYGKICILSS